MTIGELTYSLGAEWNKESLNSIKSGFDSVAKSFITAVGVASTAMAGTFGAVKEFAEANDEIGKLAKNRGVAVSTLDALRYSFEGAGLEASKTGEVLEKLQEQKEGFRNGKADYDALARLGINPNAYKTNEEFFHGVIDGLKKIQDPNLQTDLSKRILGTTELKSLIDGGSEAIINQKKELQELGVLLSDQDYKTSAKFNDQLLQTWKILKGVLNKALIPLMDVFTSLMLQFKEFYKTNRSIISSGITTFFSVLVNSAKFFFDLLGRIITHLMKFKYIGIVIAGIIALWQLPLIIAIASVVAVMLAFDDLMNFIEGKDSVIGDFVNAISSSFEEFKNSFPALGAIFQAQIDNVIAVFNFLKDSLFNIWGSITGKLSFVDFLESQIDLIAQLLTEITNSFLRAFDSIGNVIKDTFKSIPFMDKLFGSSSPAPQVQSMPQPVQTANQVPTNTQSTVNNYITANVDAKSKPITQAIHEINTPSGY